MSMISFAFFALTAFTFLALFIIKKAVKSPGKCAVAQKTILIVASYVFIIYADWRFAAVLAMLTVATWLCAKRKKTVKFGVIIALISLGFFKYANFFAESFMKLFGNDFTALNLILPLGISFYTFSAISYLLDVKREKITPHGIIDVASYLSFFPKITSGPIQKSGDFFEQTQNGVTVGLDTFCEGAQIFVFGLFKKVVLADHITVFVDQVFETPKVFGSMTVFLAIIAYALQIYFDFSGYSDMAIGVSRLLGIKLPKNFDLPYISHNVTEFWKRWHITLSSWLQEYVYFSLGGNRKGKIRTYINLVITMVIGGIWHGANWTFVAWGLLHGVALAIHKIWMTITKSKEKNHGAFSSAVSILTTFLFTSFAWVFFRADSFESAFEIIKQAFNFSSGLENINVWVIAAIIVLIGSTVFAIVRSSKNKELIEKKNVSYVHGEYPLLDLSKFWQLVAFFVFCGIVIGLMYTGGSPFIYGNF